MKLECVSSDAQTILLRIVYTGNYFIQIDIEHGHTRLIQ